MEKKDFNELAKKIQSAKKDLSKLPEKKLDAINNKFNFDPGKAAECGEPRSFLSTCTKITTNTRPCQENSKKPIDTNKNIDHVINKPDLIEKIKGKITPKDIKGDIKRKL